MNKFICNARLTKDVEVKVTQNNTKIANVSVAVRRNYKDAEGNYNSDFFNCVAFGNQAEFLEKYFKKGQEILISGHLQNRSWETESGEKRYATDIIIETVDFIGSKQNNTSELENKPEVEVKEEDGSDSLPF